MVTYNINRTERVLGIVFYIGIFFVIRIDRQTDRPICIMLNWLLAGHKQVMKYANIYLEEGFDVMRVSCEPWQLMWPNKGAKVSKDINFDFTLALCEASRGAEAQG